MIVPLLLLLAGVVVVLIGNDYRIDETRLTIPTTGGSLDAVLAAPKVGTARGLVVMIHGDGPVEATHDGLYRPWFEAAADAGFATLAWSKPGVGASTGDWLRQSMDDRAAEASAAIDWARRQPGVPSGPLVLWGASQAGWVLPKVAATRDDVSAVIAVSPAVNWLRQGRYNLLAELDHDGADADERARAIAASDRTRQLLAEDAGYDTYRSNTLDTEPMDAARWDFVRRNYRSDATADLRAMSAKPVTVLLMLGEHDRNVDIAETEATYQRILGDKVTTARFDAAHSMARPVMEDSTVAGLVTGVFWPRALFAGGVLHAYRDFLAARCAGCGQPGR
ncbi:putative X-Pro dipeptidyl-peptidase [Actinoplanes missouriensis 431]|uniref:Putative X-Pro dipeptidyl-peptidase n=1 Tax=Actinoplanes missouriensis (strain ATCC 14538 / DSM 43046 / CBS 188.64 / JCM 3121 / NBRC 102363 / NCIMB 12654 / NRRL B-3342 / UNCC 431) TaxID=512565 RepID=I0H5L5_ACTM4|nr:alpha/beta hydrolase [Actinoplanes missouriensis]BAL88302.1 putative X-Pro dipeptidyl-peptidase [Actinoplanes missouriensis 431]